jgi:hypothetical protein
VHDRPAEFAHLQQTPACRDVQQHDGTEQQPTLSGAETVGAFLG